MNSNQTIGRCTGLLLLFVFVTGILIFQILQGPILFSKDYLTHTSAHSNQIISSVVLGIFSGSISIGIAAILLPVFKKYSSFLAYLYLAFCIINFFSIMIDNVSVISMLEISKEYINNENNSSLKILGAVAYETHWWTHYFYLLISCFPVFILYFTLYQAKLIPRLISIFGLAAVLLMFIEELFSIFGQSISMNMLLPIALVQLVLPLWLIFKGLNSSPADTESN